MLLKILKFATKYMHLKIDKMEKKIDFIIY